VVEIHQQDWPFLLGVDVTVEVYEFLEVHEDGLDLGVVTCEVLLVAVGENKLLVSTFERFHFVRLEVFR